MDMETKVQWMQLLMNEDPYAQMIAQFSDDPECREIIRQKKKYRLKNGSLCVHEEEQDSKQQYWRVVVPDDKQSRQDVLKELHCVPYAGHPGYVTTPWRSRQRHLLLGVT